MARSVAVADQYDDTLDDKLSPERIQHDETLRRLVAWFEEAEEASQTAREKAERDRDYYDNKQWTEEEAAELRRRGQPVIALNLIRSRINYHLGMEKKQRRDPKAFGRGPQDQQGAEVATEALRYAMERTDYSTERSGVWENIKIEGCGALEMTMVPRKDGNQDVKTKRIPWDRFFFDPHSARPDFSDARYLGQVKWMDEAEVLDEYPDADLAVETTMQRDTSGRGDTYSDRPKQTVWADSRRKRLRVVQCWYVEGGQWFFAEFVRGGILSAGQSPFVDDQDESLCGIIAESCYVDRENNRYGEVRDLIDPQDEVNKRRSKALHLINMRTIITEKGSVPDGDVEKTRREANRPDGFVEVTKGFRFDIDKNIELAQGQTIMGQEAMAHIMRTGPNAALLGKGTEDQSGRAIQAQQQGGLIELGDGLDVLRRLDHRVFKFTWCALKQYWQAPMWVRVTEDPEAPMYIGLNQPQMDPQTGQMFLQNEVGSMDVDIIIEDAPDVPTLEGETFAAVMDVLGKGAPPPVMKFIAEMHPGLKPSVKRKLQAMADEMMQSPPDPITAAEKQATIRKLNAEAQAKEGAAQGDQMKAQAEAEKMALEREKLQLEREQMALEAQQHSQENEIKLAELRLKAAELDAKLKELDMRGVEAREHSQIEREKLEDGKSARRESTMTERMKLAKDADERDAISAEAEGRKPKSDQIAEMLAQFAQMTQAQLAELGDQVRAGSGPRELVRDENGRAIGVRDGSGNVRRVLRGEDGRAMGIE